MTSNPVATYARMSAPPDIQHAANQLEYAGGILASLKSHERAPALYTLAERTTHTPIRLVLLYEWWNRCVNMGTFAPHLLDMLESARADVPFEQVAQIEDRTFYDSLPERVLVWGGVFSQTIRQSWTTDRKVAEEFAMGDHSPTNPPPEIWQATVSKKFVLLAHANLQESEIVIRSRHARIVPGSLHRYDPKMGDFYSAT